MTPREKNNTSATKTKLFGDLHCEEILYRIKITHDKFDYASFTKAIGQSPDRGEWGDVVCPSRDSDYHAHIAWTDQKTLIRVQVGFYTDDPEPSLISKEPIHAEECVAFMGKFFGNESAQAHIHADFDFKSGKQSKFPLPLRTTIGACKAEIDAIGLKLSEFPCGVSQLWIVQGKDGLSSQMYADRKVVFETFSVANDLKDLLSVIDGLTETR